MENSLNSTPAERVDTIIFLIKKSSAENLAFYLLDELANKAHHKRFDDKCYWLDVLQEFSERSR